MKWNQDIFINNIHELIEKHCSGKYVLFNSAIGHRDAVTRWKKPGYRPSLDVLLTITDKFPSITLDWLISDHSTGTVFVVGECEATWKSGEDFMAAWPEEIRNACRQLKDILLSDHPVIKPALISNLAAFQYSVDKEKSQDEQIRNLSRRLQDLENRHKAKQDTGTEEAASSSTGKRKT